MRYVAHVILVAVVVIALCFLCSGISTELWHVFEPAFSVYGAGSLPFYATWLLLCSLYAIAHPELAGTPWRITSSITRSDIAIAALAALGAIVMYMPAFIRVVDVGPRVPDPPLILVGGGIVGPFLEEWLFRGLVWNQLRKTAPGTAGLVTAIVVGAILFGLWHLPFDGVTAMGLNLAFVHAAFGLLLGVMRWRLDGILPGVLLHIFGNSMFMLASSR